MLAVGALQHWQVTTIRKYEGEAPCAPAIKR